MTVPARRADPRRLPLGSALAAALIGFAPAQSDPATTAQTTRTRHLVVLERGPNWPSAPDDARWDAMRAHALSMRELFARGVVRDGGPAPDRSYGVAIFDVAVRAELDRLLQADAAVKAGVLVPTVRAYDTIAAAPERPADAAPGLEPVRHEVFVAASLADTWQAWTTSDGAETFFAPEVTIELVPGGRLEVLFFPDNEPGQRGAEGLHVLAWSPLRMLAFEWDAPPRFATARKQPTMVVVELEAIAPQYTKVVLVHHGFDERARSDPDAASELRDVRAYFDEAWPRVLQALQKRFTDGPRRWPSKSVDR